MSIPNGGGIGPSHIPKITPSAGKPADTEKIKAPKEGASDFDMVMDAVKEAEGADTKIGITKNDDGTIDMMVSHTQFGDKVEDIDKSKPFTEGTKDKPDEPTGPGGIFDIKV